MVRENDYYQNQVAFTPPEPLDARLAFICTIYMPQASRLTCLDRRRHDRPVYVIESHEPGVAVLKSLAKLSGWK